MIADRVTVNPLWRGRRLGPLRLATVVLGLGGTGGVAACYPSVFELAADDPERSKSTRRLKKIWRKIGFREYEEGVMIFELLGIDMFLALDAVSSTRLDKS